MIFEINFTPSALFPSLISSLFSMNVIEFTSEESEYDANSSDNSDYETDSEYLELSAEEQWQESMQQFNHIFSCVLFPLVGKMLGRKFSHLLWNRVADWWFE